MKVAKLSGEAARQLLLNLVDQALITTDQLKNILTESPTAEIKRITDLVHLLLCRSHLSSATESCSYYNEERLENSFAQPEHQVWLHRVLRLLEDLNINTEDDFQAIFQQANAVQSKITRLKDENPNAYRILALMNGWETLT